MRLIVLIILTVLISSCTGNQKKLADKNQLLFSKIDTVSKQKFILLQFVAGGKPCMSLMNSEFKEFDRKKEFPLSVFITVKTLEKNKEGHPIGAEVVEFNRLEREILTKTASLSLCYIGHTTMDGYQDLIFFIKSADQQKFNSLIKEIKEHNSRITDYTFEKDPEWEAVSEFYNALK